jgi:hypothetical protein
MIAGCFYYLGSPYTHANHVIRRRRYELALMATIELMHEGVHVFSPVLHNYPVQVNGGPPGSWGDGAFWQQYDYNMLDRCDGLIVLKLTDWEKSVGLTDEINRMHEKLMPIFYRDAPDPTRHPAIFDSYKFNKDLIGSIKPTPDIQPPTFPKVNKDPVRWVQTGPDDKRDFEREK